MTAGTPRGSALGFRDEPGPRGRLPGEGPGAGQGRAGGPARWASNQAQSKAGAHRSLLAKNHGEDEEVGDKFPALCPLPEEQSGPATQSRAPGRINPPRAVRAKGPEAVASAQGQWKLGDRDTSASESPGRCRLAASNLRSHKPPRLHGAPGTGSRWGQAGQGRLPGGTAEGAAAEPGGAAPTRVPVQAGSRWPWGQRACGVQVQSPGTLGVASSRPLQPVGTPDRCSAAPLSGWFLMCKTQEESFLSSSLQGR